MRLMKRWFGFVGANRFALTSSFNLLVATALSRSALGVIWHVDAAASGANDSLGWANAH